MARDAYDIGIPRWITVDEAARLLSCTPNTVYALVRQGEIPSVKLGRKFVRIPVDELRGWMEAKTSRRQEARYGTETRRRKTRLSLLEQES